LFGLYFLYQLAQGTFEIKRLAAPAAYQVLVPAGLLGLIGAAGLSQPALFDETQFFEEVQVPVNSGGADTAVFFGCPPEEFPGIDMPFGLADDIEEQAALPGMGMTLHVVIVFENGSHSHIIAQSIILSTHAGWIAGGISCQPAR